MKTVHTQAVWDKHKIINFAQKTFQIAKTEIKQLHSQSTHLSFAGSCKLQPVTFRDTMWKALVETCSTADGMWLNFRPCFHGFTLVCLFFLLVCGGNNLTDSSWSVCSSLYVVNRLNKWKVCKALMQRCIKLVKNVLCYEIFMLLRQDFLFKWETY